MFSPQVTLPSGGYLVINPTEALVSIDVNSGRSTKEHNIEDTALQTNLEAAEEVSRQLRLRDLAGLIVIDFIDMMENRSNRAVERKLKEALKNDRARIQVGRISHFGLLEMSRQRIRQGVVESSTHKCPTCNGTGLIRSVESLALMVMRNVEEHVMKKPGQSINLKVPVDVALYILNTKRGTLANIEAKYGLSVTVVADDHVGPSHYAIERGEPRVLERGEQAGTHVRVDTATLVETAEDAADALIEDDEEEEEATSSGGGERQARSDENGERSGRRRRRRRRGGDREDRPPQQNHQQPRVAAEATSDDEEGDEAEGEASVNAGERDENGEPRRRRRRGRRGGRRNRRDENGAAVEAGEVEAVEPAVAEAGTELTPEAADVVAATVLAQDAIAADVGATPEVSAEAPAEKPKRGRRRKAEPVAEAAAEAAPAEAVTEAPAPAPEAEAEPAARPKRTRAPRKKAAPPAEAEAVAAAEEIAAVTAPEAPAAEAAPAEEKAPSRRRKKEIPEGEIVVSSTAPAPVETPETTAEEPTPKKVGWWQRRLGLG
jgi:ribonuclease E